MSPGYLSKSTKINIFKLRPGDFVLLGILLIITITIVLKLNKAPVAPEELYFHLGILIVFAILLVISATELLKNSSVIRIIASIVIIFTLYKSLGQLGFKLMPYQLDQMLSEIDTAFFNGINPTFVLQEYITPLRVEFFSFIYLLFIVYVYLSIILSCLGREPWEREEFLFGLTLVYSLGYLGYIFTPAHGPVVFHALEYAVPLQGYFIHDFLVEVINSLGGPKGAFPSLHVGGAAFLCLFDFTRNRFRSLTYFPVVILILIATIYLRYHYLIDWIGGLGIALFALWLCPKITAFWETKRKEAGLLNGR